MYFIKPKTHFLKNFENFTAFSLYSIVILLNFIPKTTLIARRVSIFTNHLRKSGSLSLMEELHTDSIDGGHEASYGPRSRARVGRTPTII